MIYDWIRVSKKVPCPICGKDHWCLLHKSRGAAICPRIFDGCVKDLGDAGYLHILGTMPPDRKYELPRNEPKVPARGIEPPPPDWNKVVEEYRRGAHGGVLLYAENILGVSSKSLRRLELGIAGKSAWSFPMIEPGRGYIGVRIRKFDGKKWAHSGSRNGLFYPSELSGEGPLLVCEGPTDTAAALDLGFDAVGRPNCNGAVEMCLDAVRGRTAVIFADRDGPGLDGAAKLADWIVRQSPSKGCKVITAPRHKDLREWKRDGLTSGGLRALIDAAAWWRPS